MAWRPSVRLVVTQVAKWRAVPARHLSLVASMTSSTTEPLVDTFGRRHDYLRISLTERCNLRCQYCMPAEGVELTPDKQLLSLPELEKIVHVFAGLGVRKVRLTGGEPLVRRDIVDIVAMLNGIPGIEEVHMTTNGVTLSRKLAPLKAAGLAGLNVSLDTLTPAKFEFITRRRGMDKVLEAVKQAVAMEINQVKLNCVVMKGLNDDELTDFVQLTDQLPISVRFIEYMPFSGNRWNFEKFVAYRDMLAMIMGVWPHLVKIKDGKNDTTKSYKVPGYCGSVGFITSMSNHFCSSCNRLRITADGNLKVCLFGSAEVPLRDALRRGDNDEEITQLISAAVSRKKKQHAGMFNLSKMKNRPMILIDHPSPPTTVTPRSLPLPIIPSGYKPTVRHSNYSAFSHISDSGSAQMVDVTNKPVTSRFAIASGKIYLNEEAIQMVEADERSHKGSVLGVAEIAAIMAAKRTADIVPLCHTLPLSHVGVAWDVRPEERCVVAMVTVRTEGKTGVEMEALLGVTVALVTVFDMTKSVSHEHIISDIRVEEKGGGRSGHTHFHKH